jgi:hypothetical protein
MSNRKVFSLIALMLIVFWSYVLIVMGKAFT